MTFFQDLIEVNKSAFNKAIKAFSKNWYILFAGIAYTIINIVIYSLIGILFRGPLSLIAGFIAGFVSAATISNYLYLLYNVIYYNKLSIEIFKEGFTVFLRHAYSVLILMWIIDYFLGVFGIISSTGAFQISSILGIVILVALNALPETIYQKQYGGMESLSYSLNFIKENPVHWFLPVIIFNLVLYILTGNFINSVLATGINMSLSLEPIALGRNLVAQALFSFMMIYRGFLYQTLSTSTRRKREFMGKF